MAFVLISAGPTRHGLISLFSLMLFDQCAAEKEEVKGEGTPGAVKAENIINMVSIESGGGKKKGSEGFNKQCMDKRGLWSGRGGRGGGLMKPPNWAACRYGTKRETCVTHSRKEREAEVKRE